MTTDPNTPGGIPDPTLLPRIQGLLANTKLPPNYMLALSPFGERKVGDLRTTSQYCIQHFGNLGISINPSSRLGLHLALLNRILGGLTNLDIDRQEHFLRAIVDIADFELIASHASSCASDDIYRKKAVLLLNDAATLTGRETSGRDTQFELILAAMGSRADFAISLEEPDLVVHHDSEPFGIAAKRIKSEAKLSRRVRQGSNQILSTTYRGIVATDLTPIIQPRGKSLVIPNRNAASGATISVVREVMKQNVAQVRRSINLDRVAGWLGYVHLSGFCTDDKTPVQWAHLEFIAHPRAGALSSIVLNFIQACAVATMPKLSIDENGNPTFS